jgi:ubiquinone/menaquinone biosynthesis C-methylase UbiE
MTFKDLFSKQTKQYSQFRPTYPKELFEYLNELVKQHHCVWDCGTGNGQAAVALADYFDKVIATDASAEQIKKAKQHPKVQYEVAPAEKTNILDHSVDLITVAQALHWFDFSKFYAEVRRVLKPGGHLAAWTYPFVKFENEAIQKVFIDFALGFLKNYWAKERAYCDNRYKDIPFELKEIKAPEFSIPMQYTLPDLIGYLQTWSAVQTYKDKHHTDPVIEIALPELEKVWGDPNSVQKAKMDFVLKVGCVD